jgi:hypothetical protein
MKSCLGLLLVLFLCVVVVGGAGLIFYLSQTAEFSRRDAAVPPAARIVPGR